MASQQLEEIMKDKYEQLFLKNEQDTAVLLLQVKLQKVTNKKSWWNCQH